MRLMAIKKKIAETCSALSDVPVIGGILKPKPKIAVVRMSGVIADSNTKRGGISFQKYESILENAFDLHNLKAVALLINSPGGSPAQSQLIGDKIRQLAEEKEVPVYAFTEDVAASGGYWLACAADEIYAVPSSIIGSIGVISASFGFKELIERYGIERRVHTAGKDKGFLDPFTEEKPADVKRLKTLQKDLHTLFTGWVKERRGQKVNGTDKELFEGAFWTAEKALEYGLIDGLESYKPMCKERFGDDVKFINFGPEKGFISSLINPDAKMNMARDTADILEEKAIWGRFGL